MLGSDYFMVGLRIAPRLRSRARDKLPENRWTRDPSTMLCQGDRSAGIGKQDDVVGERVELR